MDNKHVDEAEGRIKEAAGSVTDNQRLQNEGNADQAKASLKDTVDKTAEHAKVRLDRDR